MPKANGNENSTKADLAADLANRIYLAAGPIISTVFAILGLMP